MRKAPAPDLPHDEALVLLREIRDLLKSSLQGRAGREPRNRAGRYMDVSRRLGCAHEVVSRSRASA